jgi:hypothetical protein
VNRHTSITYTETGTGGLDYSGHGDPTSDTSWSVSSTGSIVGLMAIEGTRVAAVPEPSTIVLAFLGVGIIALRRTRR